MTITCPQCGHQNPDDTEFCEQCGAQLPATVAVGSKAVGSPISAAVLQPAAAVAGPQLICPNPDCRAPLVAGDEFCFNCGTDVRSITSLKATPTANGAAAQPAGMKDEDIEKALAEIGIPTSAEPAPVAPTPPVVNPAASIEANAFSAPPAPVQRGTGPLPPPTPAHSITGTLQLHIGGPYGSEIVEWKGQEILLGRNDAKTRVFPDVNLDDGAASRRHLAIWREDSDGLYYAQDLESANGTTLNGSDLKAGEPTELHDGDVMKIGTRYSIQVRIS